MFSKGVNTRKLPAALLLGLFVFIQVEKNLHEHAAGIRIEVQKGYPVLQPLKACTICDFQLAANADLPFNSWETFTFSFRAAPSSFIPSFYCTLSPCSLSERGPPVHLPKL